MSHVDTNLDFEYELFHGQRPKSKHIITRLKAWSTLLRLLPQWSHAHPWDDQPTDQLMAWGWTARHRAICPDIPCTEAVLEANSKLTSHAIERQNHCALPLAQQLQSVDEARLWLKQLQGPWVIKHPFGVGGRDRIVGHTEELEPRLQKWLERQLQHSPCLAEPWIERTIERSTQLLIHRDGTFDLLGTLTLICDQTGTFRGHHTSPTHEAPLQSPQLLNAIVQTIHQLGYHGPLGIDAMEGTWRGQVVQRPIVEINARWTFGHMALALRAHLPPNAEVIWKHPDRHTKTQPELAPCHQHITDAGTYRLPEHIDPHHHTRSVVHVAFDTTTLNRLAPDVVFS